MLSFARDAGLEWIFGLLPEAKLRMGLLQKLDHMFIFGMNRAGLTNHMQVLVSAGNMLLCKQQRLYSSVVVSHALTQRREFCVPIPFK
eukprot:3306300-Amphidinium_carterae.1